MTLAARLGAALAASRGRRALRGEVARDATDLRPAAVLVAVTERPQPGVLLTLRTAHLRHHAGQIAFPGGRVDAEDADGIAAALREAEEEIGLPRDLPEVVGVSNRFRTRTAFDILPVVAVVPPDLVLTPHEYEVADIFEVPLAHLLDSANHVRRTVEDETWGRRRYWEIQWLDRRIWGVTAGIIANLARRLEGFA